MTDEELATYAPENGTTSLHQLRRDDEVVSSVVVGNEAPIVEEEGQIDLAVMTGEVRDAELAKMRQAAEEVVFAPKTETKHLEDGPTPDEESRAGDAFELDDMTVRICGATEVASPMHNEGTVGAVTVEAADTVAAHVTERTGHAHRGPYTDRVLGGLEHEGVPEVNRATGAGIPDIDTNALFEYEYESEQDRGTGRDRDDRGANGDHLAR